MNLWTALCLLLGLIMIAAIVTMCVFVCCRLLISLAGTAAATVDDAKRDVLIALSQIIDPDFGTDIVSCGFVKDLEISEALEEVRKG